MVIQRKVGLEFETAWLVTTPKRKLALDEPIIKGAGWELIPDTAGAEANMDYPKHDVGAMEFTTKAFVDDDVKGLKGAMLDIYDMTSRLEGAKNGAQLEDFRGGRSWGKINNYGYGVIKDVLVRPRGSLAAKPQLTAGISLEHLWGLLADLATDKGVQKEILGGGKGAEVDAAIIGQSFARARDMADKRHQEHKKVGLSFDYAKYLAVVALLAKYIFRAQKFSGKTYEKASQSLLSRTNFGDLPWSNILAKSNFIGDVLYATNLFGDDMDDLSQLAKARSTPLFPRGQIHKNITVMSWIMSIVEGKDPLSWGQTKDTDRWKPQIVGPSDQASPGQVYEFRGLEDGISHKEWLDLALHLQAYIAQINRGKRGYSPRKK